MQLSQILYFCTVCEYGSVTKAAEVLHISQPSVSAAIKDLETELGVNLFSRKNKHMIITREGDYFWKKASRILEDSDHLRNEMLDIGNKNNSIIVGIPPMISAFMATDIYAKFRKDNPHIQIEYLESTDKQSWQMVEDETVDIAIAELDPSRQSKFEVIPFYELEYMFCVAKNSPFSRYKSVNINQIRDIPLATLSVDSNFSQILSSTYNLSKNDLKITFQTTQLFTLIQWINTGTACGFLSKEIAELCHDFVAIPVENMPKTKIGLVYKPNKVLFNSYLKFIEHMKTYKYEPAKRIKFGEKQTMHGKMYSAETYAVLYGLIIRILMSYARGEDFDTLAEKFTNKIGERRGARRRALADKYGLPADMVTYRGLQEWNLDNSGLKKEYVCSVPYEHVKNYNCPWVTAWKKYNLLSEGYYYCKYIDAALLRGFNSELRMDLLSWQSDGVSPCCDFIWYDFKKNKTNLNRIAEIKKMHGDEAILPWEDLICMMKEDFISECGDYLGSSIDLFFENVDDLCFLMLGERIFGTIDDKQK